MKAAACLAAVAAFLVLFSLPASAATTTFDLNFSNASGKALSVEIYGSGFNSKQDLPAGGQINFNIQAPAHFMTHRTFSYRGTVLDQESQEILGYIDGNESNIWDAGPKVNSCNVACSSGLNCQITKQTPNRGACQFIITIGE